MSEVLDREHGHGIAELIVEGEHEQLAGPLSQGEAGAAEAGGRLAVGHYDGRRWRQGGARNGLGGDGSRGAGGIPGAFSITVGAKHPYFAAALVLWGGS